MDVAAEIKKALKEALGENPNLPITATVVSVEDDTCTVKLLGNLVLSDVRLKATITESLEGLLIIPKVASEVILISQTGKLSSLMVLKVSEVEKIIYKIDDFVFEVDATTKKLTFKKSGANFGALIGSLIDTISAAIITTPNGQGSIDSTTQSKLQNIKTKFNSIINTV